MKIHWPQWPYTKRLDALGELLGSVRHSLHAIQVPPPKPPDPFVCAFVEAIALLGEDDQRPMTMGASGRAKENGTVLELTPHVNLRDARITVFADLERVSVHGLFFGPDLMTAALGDCPIAYLEHWPIAIKVRVQCTLRRP